MPDRKRLVFMLRWLLLALLVLLLDWLTKNWIASQLVYAQRLEVLPVFDLVYLHNPGAAFSFLAEASGWQRWFFILVGLFASVLILGWLSRLQTTEIWTAVALMLILGGAWGNVYDRIMHGYVIDFLAFHWKGSYFPAFNLADSAITLGALLLIWQTLRHSAPSRKSDT